MLTQIHERLRSGCQKAVFFMGPYSVPMSKLRLPLYLIRKAGYSVITYEYPRTIFRTGEPDRLITAIDETREHLVKTVATLKAQGYNEFGFMGNSLGSLIVYNCFKAVPEFGWGILNGGGDVAEAVWNFETERKHFEDNGFTYETLRKAWQEVQYPDLGDLKGKSFILISSHGDKTTTITNALKTRDHILAAGPDTEIIMHKRLDHFGTVGLNLLRAHKLVKKAASQSKKSLRK